MVSQEKQDQKKEQKKEQERRMLDFGNKRKVVVNEGYYHLRDGNKDYKCIVGYMACQAKIPIPFEFNDDSIDAVNEEMSEFRQSLMKAYYITEHDLMKIQELNDNQKVEDLKEELINLNLLPENSKLTFVGERFEPEDEKDEFEEYE